MTVQVMPDAAAVGLPAVGNTDRAAEKPYVYMPRENEYPAPVRQLSASGRKRGFGSVLAAQLIISAVFGAALWAGLSFGGEGAAELCEGLTELFR